MGLLRRKNFLINRPFQLTFMAYMAFFSVFVSSVVYVANSYFFWKFEAKALEMGMSPDHLFFSFLEKQKDQMDFIFIIAAFGATTILLIGGLFLSHRVAGPLYRLSKHMEEMASGDKFKHVHFRKGDFFPELAENYNKQVDKISKV